MNELFDNWKFDGYHIGAVMFLIAAAVMVTWIVKDSWFKKKKDGKS